jgi:hypothetical protein
MSSKTAVTFHKQLLAVGPYGQSLLLLFTINDLPLAHTVSSKSAVTLTIN